MMTMALRSALLVLAVALSAHAQGPATSGDCKCSCCHTESDSSLAECKLQDYFFMAGNPATCNPDVCRARFQQCPDEGSHNSGKVFATYEDCECSCCHDKKSCDAGDYFTGRFLSKSKEVCSKAVCQARFASCLDEGDHNIGAQTMANFLGASQVAGECTCLCCMGDKQCRDFRDYKRNTFVAASESVCSTDVCSARFATCPDPGTHNNGGNVFVSYTPMDKRAAMPPSSRDGEMPWWAAVLVAGAVGAAFVGAIWVGRSYLAYRRGYAWVNMRNPVFQNTGFKNLGDSTDVRAPAQAFEVTDVTSV